MSVWEQNEQGEGSGWSGGGAPLGTLASGGRPLIFSVGKQRVLLNGGKTNLDLSYPERLTG